MFFIKSVLIYSAFKFVFLLSSKSFSTMIMNFQCHARFPQSLSGSSHLEKPENCLVLTFDPLLLISLFQLHNVFIQCLTEIFKTQALLLEFTIKSDRFKDEVCSGLLRNLRKALLWHLRDLCIATFFA